MNQDSLKIGLDALCLIDEDIKQAISKFGSPQARTRISGFKGFLQAIVGQQLSTKAAATIMQRVVTLMQEEITPQQLLNLSTEQLRSAGLSYRKVEYAQGLAQAVLSGSFNIDGLAKLNNEDAINEITKLRGFGRWSAEIYLLFALGREDVFPADDLGVLVGLQYLKALPEKPTPKQAREMIAHWAPYRSAGSMFMWHCYHHYPINK